MPEAAQFMELSQALDTVIDLARQNIPDERDVPATELQKVERMHVACDMLTSFNNSGLETSVLLNEDLHPADAAELATELARDNIPDERDVDAGMRSRVQGYKTACDVVDDFAVNHLGDN